MTRSILSDAVSTGELTIGSSWPARAEPPAVDIVLPVYNEAHVLDPSIRRLHRYLTGISAEPRRSTAPFPFPWRITIVDNASTDGTWTVAQELATTLPDVVARRLDAKGRGRALRAAWTTSDAAVLAYMDVDLSTDLDALLPLVAPLLSGHSDLAVGSRLLPGSRVVRGPRREAISRAYNRLLQLVLRTRVHDAQCGFKAVRADVAARLVPAVQDDAWFFDTELLVLAERCGLRIAEVPVDWCDDPDSRVDVAATAWADLRGIVRLVRTLWSAPTPVALGPAARSAPPVRTGGDLVSFAAVGVLCTVLFVVSFLALRETLGPVAANALCLTATMVVNTAANRRVTFGRRGSTGRLHHWTRSAGVHLAGLALTTLALLAADRYGPESLLVETAAVLVASAGATALRLLLMPGWVFGPIPEPAPSGDPSQQAAPDGGDAR